MPERKFFQKKDIWIVAGLLAAALCLWLWWSAANKHGQGSGLTAEVYVGGELVQTVDLDTERTFAVDGLPNVVLEIKEHTIAFVSSDCPDQVCIAMGAQTAGGFAACLPNKALLWVAQAADGPDTMTR